MIAAAATVLGREGYENTSMKEIALEAGVSSGLLHYYFGTKEELLAAVVRQLHEGMVAEWKAAMVGVGDPFERIASGLRQAAEKCQQRPEFFQLLFDMYAVGLKNQRIRDALQEMVEEMIGQITAEADTVVGELPTPSPIAPGEIAMATLGAIDGIALMSLLTRQPAGGAYRALTALMLSYAALSYLAAGHELPIERLMALLEPAAS